MGPGLYDGRKESSNPFEQTVHLLSVLGRAADAMLDRRLAGQDLGRVHRSVLTVLAREGPHGVPDLARRADAPVEEVRGAVEALLARGLVQVVPVRVHDGREDVVMPVPAGRGALDAVHAEAAVVQETLTAMLTRGDSAQLNNLLRRMHAGLGTTVDAGSPPSMLRKVRGRTWSGAGGRPRERRAGAPLPGREAADDRADDRPDGAAGGARGAGERGGT
ncbi:MarR family winged helix-turn-helix transcriptional regulator [Kitasatospora cineracea]|uniref:MarR family winged helix-turn-helix transcriptional regulator n=1 Tax=Kitasatospora cineracea TaxID=88074 RepID=UPI0033D9CA9F